MVKSVQTFLIVILVLNFVLMAAIGGYLIFFRPDPSQNLPATTTGGVDQVDYSLQDQEIEVGTFESVDEFKEYLTTSQETYGDGGYFYNSSRIFTDVSTGMDVALDVMEESVGMEKQAAVAPTAAGNSEVNRVSETNVQVKGIDEPDIVKTDGKEIYYSTNRRYYPVVRELIADDEEGLVPSAPKPAPEQKGGVKLIKAFPPEELGLDATIDEIGNLLLYENVLVIFVNDKIYGYDVVDPKNPAKQWEVELDDRYYLSDSRLYDGKIYLVARRGVDYTTPCPLNPMVIEGQEVSISCAEIYRPNIIVPTDITYSVISLDAKTGQVQEKTAFVGSSSGSVMYMSTNSIYVTYQMPGEMIKLLYGFLAENTDIFPSWLINKVGKLIGYDISLQSKLNESRTVLEQYMYSLDSDESLRIENELANRMESYISNLKRETSKTGIVKIDIDDFKVTATGKVPGNPLNQFSLDEYDGYLRIATTVGQTSLGMYYFGDVDTENDLYVLDKDLNQTGSVLGMGVDERIYSARFIQDKGYIVTFKQTDPFYVLDLSNPKKPELAGELKIPGYSSYLHPVSEDMILGIGKEDSNVKVSLFDVSDPSEPKEAAKYSLKEYWTDILNTHHAFLLDDKFEVFFMPGNQGGYVMSYKDNKLSLLKAVSGINAKRALFVNDYLYIVGEEEIVVLDETNWEEVNNLEL